MKKEKHEEGLGSRGEPSLVHAVAAFGLALCAVIFGIRLGAGMHLPIFLALVVSCVGAAFCKMEWKDIQSALFEGVCDGLPAACILLLVGILVGLWSAGGTIPTLIYYGLGWLSPQHLVPAACLLCCLASVMTGTSYGTISTFGLALLGIGEAMGVPKPLLAGAIVSGAFFGDKMSPLSDTTNVAPAVSGGTLYGHIKSMLYTTGPGLMLSLAGFWFLGRGASPSAASYQAVLDFRSALSGTFNLGPLTLIPAVVVLTLSIRRVQPVPALTVGIGTSIAMAFLTQKTPFSLLAKAMASGASPQSGHGALDALLSRGGMEAMFSSILLILMATGMGGILRQSGVVTVLVNKLLSRVRSSKGLVLSVITSCFTVLLATGNQMLAIILPGQAFKEAFEKRSIDPNVLSRTLEDAGTLGAALVPWSTASAFIYSVLKVPAQAYAPYALLNWAVPLIATVYALTGSFIFPAKPEGKVGPGFSQVDGH